MNPKVAVVRIIQRSFTAVISVLAKTPLWYPFASAVISEVRSRLVVLKVDETTMKFHVPNDRCLFRADSLMSKEPETIEWIDSFEPEQIFWDIGACVGTYSVYAAKRKSAKVVAVEPSVFNLEWLAKNIDSNGVADRVVIAPLALGKSPSVNFFRMQVTEWGGALSSFGVDYDHEGNLFAPRFNYSTLGSSVTSLISQFGLPIPRYVKIDVDSIEHLIIEGLLPMISSVESIALENSRNDRVVEECARILDSNNFVVAHVGRANSIWLRRS